MSDSKLIEPHENTEQNAVEQPTHNDIEIECVDCKVSFIWTVGEQNFFRSKGLVNPPKRCKPCKKAKNKRLMEIESARRQGKRHHIVMPAKCANCGTMTTVPFYPSQGRPVYCKPCFRGVNAQKAEASSA